METSRIRVTSSGSGLIQHTSMYHTHIDIMADINERLIIEVEKNTILYDKRDPNYKDTTKKNDVPASF